LIFDFNSLNTERITEDADYTGISVKFLCFLGNSRINMKIDIGFGDIVFPEPKMAELPSILNFSAPKLFCYSRMKDFYDIWLLSRMFHFELSNLREA